MFDFLKKKSLATPVQSRGWLSWVVGEANTGFWQRNISYKREDVLCYHAVFSCVSLIASDICKMRMKVVRENDGIWVDVPYGKYQVLQRPNSYQNRIQFYESWVLSKLIRGNTYVFKERDSRGQVIKMHVLHPDFVLPLVSDDGQVFYQLSQDNLAGITELGVTIPASEIIHDRFNCFYHPLVGLSPLFACGLPAYMGVKILENSTKLFKNGSRPSGILTIPEAITKEKADELSTLWEEKYGGENYGRTAILGGDLKYQALTMKSDELQLVEQLKMTAEMVCGTFHVPPYKVLGNAPAYNNIEALEQAYYSQCLQVLIEAIEECLDRGLDMSEGLGTEFDLDNLLRMDTKSQVETLGEGVLKGLIKPNEGRRKLNMAAVEGGDTPYLQQQNYSLAALNRRDNSENPFGAPTPTSSTEDLDLNKAMANMMRKREGLSYEL